jgi:hypothetical protein
LTFGYPLFVIDLAHNSFATKLLHRINLAEGHRNFNKIIVLSAKAPAAALRRLDSGEAAAKLSNFFFRSAARGRI